tara:strand:- start:393 stop:863 length:471 start_codon:yes stop_codon:yes gene_type:complete
MSQRHLVECHCVLPIYKNKTPPVYHKFSVYSKIDKKTGRVIPKYVNCNNCGATHYVTELCKSEIKTGKEDVLSVRTASDIKISLPEKLGQILEEYNVQLDIYEEVEDVIDNNLYPRNIVLSREIIGEDKNYKIISLLSSSKYKIVTEIIKTTIMEE